MFSMRYRCLHHFTSNDGSKTSWILTLPPISMACQQVPARTAAPMKSKKTPRSCDTWDLVPADV